MNNLFKSTFAKFLLGGIFGIIILSFALTGYQRAERGGGGAHVDAVAEVDGTPITIREYQSALNRQLEFFTQMTGGNQLTSQQIEQFGIKQSVLSNLVNQKLMVNLVSKIGLNPSKTELAMAIQDLPYFKTNNVFNVDLYKNLLNQNSYTPTQFENMISDEVKTKAAQKILSGQLLSKNFINDVVKLKNSILNAHAVKITKKLLTKYIDVAKSEIEKYAADPNNKSKLEEAYQGNFAKYNQEEQVKANHILFTKKEKESDTDLLKRVQDAAKKITPKNFKEEANKLTEDPSGKGKGGSLDWFGRGKMVKEFDDAAFKLTPGTVSLPVKTQYGYHLILVESKKPAKSISLDLVKLELAKTLLQESKIAEADKLATTIAGEAKTLLEKGDLKGLETLKAKYELELVTNQNLNIYDSKIGSITLSDDEAMGLYKDGKTKPSVELTNPSSIILAKIFENKGAKIDDKAFATVDQEEKSNFSRKLREEIVKDMNKSAKIITYPSLL